MNLYLNSNLTPRASLVISAMNPTAIPIIDFVYGNQRATNLFLVDGIGGYDSGSGNATYSVRASIGVPGSSPLWVNTNWTAITSPAAGWSGVISTESSGILALFTSLAANPITPELEITIFNDLGQQVTDLIMPIRIWERVSVPASIDSFSTATDGEFSIPDQVDTVTVTGLNLASVPRRILIGIRKPAGGLNIDGSIVTGSITTDGFRVDLSGVTDSANYKLDYCLIF